jgi:hypothetical protein
LGACVLLLRDPRTAAATAPLYPLVHVRRCTGLLSVSRYRVGDVRYAEPTRAVLDCGLLLPTLRDVRGVVLGAVSDGRTTAEAVRELLEREPRNGTARLRRALRDAERGCASPPEAELVDALVGCRLPFLVNPEVRVNGVLVGSPDVWLVGLGCGGEMDSRERHEHDDDFDATLARHDTFGAHGLVLGHLTPRRFRRDPAAGAAALLAVARARLCLPPGLREPAGLEVRPCGPLLR